MAGNTRTAYRTYLNTHLQPHVERGITNVDDLAAITGIQRSRIRSWLHRQGHLPAMRKKDDNTYALTPRQQAQMFAAHPGYTPAQLVPVAKAMFGVDVSERTIWRYRTICEREGIEKRGRPALIDDEQGWIFFMDAVRAIKRRLTNQDIKLILFDITGKEVSSATTHRYIAIARNNLARERAEQHAQVQPAGASTDVYAGPVLGSGDRRE